MADLRDHSSPLDGPPPALNGTAAAAAASAAAAPAAGGESDSAAPYSKRQRRPSVRLGDLGALPAVVAELPFRRDPRPSKAHSRPRVRLPKSSRRRQRPRRPPPPADDMAPTSDDSAAARAREASPSVEREREWSFEGVFNGEVYDVRSWLEGIGLGRYAPVFDIHEVDADVLPMLTMEDLKDMGISAVGSRRKMLVAIQKLRRGGSDDA